MLRIRPDAVMLVSNGCSPDPRVQKEAESLTAEGYQVHVLGWDRTGLLPSRRSDRGFTIECFVRPSRPGSGFRQLASFVGFWVWAVRTALRLRPRLVHCHDLDTCLPGFVVARLLHVPLLFDAHEVYAEMQQGRMPSPLVRLLRSLDRWAARHADAFITVGEATRRYYAPLRRDISVVANWSPQVSDDAAARSQVRRQLGIPDDAFVVGHLGGLMWAKDFAPLLAALDQDPELYVLIAGEGDQSDELRARALAQPRLKFIGYTHEPAPYYHALDVLYYLFRDGFAYARFSSANALGHSFAYAKPLITDRNGDTGRVAAAVAPELILNHHTADEVLRVLHAARAEYRQLRRRLREAAAARYSWAAASQELAAVYTRVLTDPTHLHEATPR